MLQGLINEHFIYSISNLRVLLYRIRKILTIRMTHLTQVLADIMRNTRDHRYELPTLERFNTRPSVSVASRQITLIKAISRTYSFVHL